MPSRFCREFGIYGGRVHSSVTVVIPVLNDGPNLDQTVEAVLAQADDVVGEIILAIGPSDDDSMQVADELARADPRVTVMVSPTGQTPLSLNLAIGMASTPYVARIDARARIPSGYFLNALETIVATGAANVGAVQIPIGTSPKQRAIAAAMASVAGSGGARYRHSADRQEVDTAWLGFFRREVLVEVGGYDERFVRNQDAELNIRLRRAGYQVWVDGRLRVEYLPRSSIRSLATQYYGYGFWRLRTAVTHRSLRLRQMVVPIATVTVVCGALLAVVWPAAIIVPAGYVLGLLLAVGSSRESLTVYERMMMFTALVTMHTCWTAGFLSSMCRSRRWFARLARAS